MSSQTRTVIGALDSSIATLKNLKEDLQDVRAVNNQLNWAIGGIISMLSNQLLQICDQVFQESSFEQSNAHENLIKIKERFALFVNKMIDK